MPIQSSASPQKNPALGVLAVLGSNLLWGLMPIYWLLLQDVPAEQIICQRIVWSCLSCALLLLFFKKFSEVKKIFCNPRLLLSLMLCCVIICSNWLLYINMVSSGRVLEASMSMYITPLITMGFGIFIFKDKPKPLQIAAISLVIAGVLVQIKILGTLPWAALYMALSASTYGLIRALLKAGAIPGLFIENLAAVPFSLAMLFWWHSQGTLVFTSSPKLIILLLSSGIITALPLIWMVFGMRNARLITVGIMQFICPSMVFLLGIFLFKEKFTLEHFASFGLIWLAILLYCQNSLRYAHTPQNK